MRHFPLLVACFSALASIAQYNGPESVEYDPIGDRYFVSNTGSSVIKVRSQAGVVTDFVAVSPAPYGLEIMGDTLFACSGGTVKGYLLSNASLVFNRNLGGTFLNGITTDGHFLYVTDFSGTKIFKVDVANNSHTTLVANTAGTPNGIVWDEVGQRLVVVFWGSNAPIKSYDRNTGASTTLVAGTGVTNIDGITIDCFGNFLIASWSPARITRYDPSFAGAGVDVGVPGLNNPADIDFDFVNQRICIPNAGNNTVTLHVVSCMMGVPDVPKVLELRAIPNPTTGLIRIEPALTQNEGYLLLDARGLLIGGGSLRAGAMLDISALPRGLYTIEFPRTRQRMRVVLD
ncbi:MAG: SMP-30/gluconolactonase/LRE family protein [Flavobacteriales bacterium]|nr:SMP-30/gluconolactonase/LRE family protein [Flavobacteriales bacterium]MCC6936957.1 SMP-30/gluconolactonase/LRE family protein [Flavobacteriales bacterium]